MIFQPFLGIIIPRNGGVSVSLVYLKNKKNGATYVYESTGYWDKNKQQARNNRKCIGKLDPVTGEIIPSKKLENEFSRYVDLSCCRAVLLHKLLLVEYKAFHRAFKYQKNS